MTETGDSTTFSKSMESIFRAMKTKRFDQQSREFRKKNMLSKANTGRSIELAIFRIITECDECGTDQYNTIIRRFWMKVTPGKRKR